MAVCQRTLMKQWPTEGLSRLIYLLVSSLSESEFWNSMAPLVWIKSLFEYLGPFPIGKIATYEEEIIN